MAGLQIHLSWVTDSLQPLTNISPSHQPLATTILLPASRSLTTSGATYKWNCALLVWRGYNWVWFWRWISGQKKGGKVSWGRGNSIINSSENWTVMKHLGSGKKLSLGEGLAKGAMGSGRGWRCFWKSLYPCTLGEHWTPREEIFLIHKVKEKSLFRNRKAVEEKVLSYSVMSNSLWPHGS